MEAPPIVDGMAVAIVKTDEQYQAACESAAKRGLRPACVSNAGLTDGWRRVTFIEASCFTDRNDQPSGIVREPKI
jgi:hypothetical protein